MCQVIIYKYSLSIFNVTEQWDSLTWSSKQVFKNLGQQNSNLVILI